MSRTQKEVPSEREKVTAYVTKYALTSGILVVEGEICSDINEHMLC